MAAIFKPLDPTELLKPAGQLALRLEGTSALIPLGHATFNFNTSSTKSETRTPEDPNRPVIATDISEGAGTVEIEFSGLNRLGQSLAFAANVVPYTQVAVGPRTQVFEAQRAEQWLELTATDDENELGLINTVVTKVSIGGVDLPTTHYRHDSASGIVQVTKFPDGADVEEDISVTFSAPEVTAEQSVDASQLLREFNWRGRLVLRQNNLRGRNRKVIIPLVAFGGDSTSVAMIQDGNDVVKIKVTASIVTDYSQKPGFETGYTVEIVTKKAA